MNGNCPGGYSLQYTSNEMSKQGRPEDPTSLPARISQDFIDHAELYKPFQPLQSVPTLAFTNEEQEELDLIQSTIFAYVKEMEAKFIIGAEELAAWDEYVAALKAMGIDRMMEIYQAAYNRLMGV